MKPLRSHFQQISVSLLDLFFPKRCAGCRETWLSDHEGFWCEECLNRLLWIQPPLCPRCGRPFPKSPSSPNHLCGECLSDTFFFDSARSANIYSGVVRERIHQFKFGKQLHWGVALAELAAMAFQKQPFPSAEVILPVPLHTKRLRERGFNQSGLISGVLGRKLNLPVHYDVLIRTHWTKPQTRLSREERLENVKNAFDVSKPSVIKNRSVLLLDDVFTTGTTLNECAKVLKSGGAAQVHALTVARALRDWREPEIGEQEAEVGSRNLFGE